MTKERSSTSHKKQKKTTEVVLEDVESSLSSTIENSAMRERKSKKERAVAADAVSQESDSVDNKKSKKRKASASTEALNKSQSSASKDQVTNEAIGTDSVMDVEKAESAEEDPEAGLSHKEKRKRRKLAEAASKAAADGESTTEGLAGDNAEKKVKAPPSQVKRSQYSVWIGNMLFSTSSDTLVHWIGNHLGIKWIPNGSEGEGITRVYMPKGPRKFELNKGFAYVDFSTKEQMEACVGLSEKNLDGRALLIKPGSSFEGRPTPAVAPGGMTKSAAKILSAQKNPACETLFIGNLGFGANEADLREFLNSHAERQAESEARNKLKKEKEDARNSAFKKERSLMKSIETGNDKSSTEVDTEDAEMQDTKTELEAKFKNDDIEDVDSQELNVRAKPKSNVKADKPAGAGIRKIRLACFEDTPDKCKGFGFIDFHTIQLSTAALLDIRNHSLDGRSLVLQFASAEAVRRGGGRGAAKAREQGNDVRTGPRPKPTGTVVTKSGKTRQSGGAALAQARRGDKGSIKPSEGKKVVFEDEE